MTPEKRNQVILLAVGTLAVVGVLYFTLIGGLQTALKSRRQSVQVVKRELELYRTTVSDAARNQAELERSREQLIKLEALMPGRDPYRWMTRSLDRLIGRHEIVSFHCPQHTDVAVEIPPWVPYTAAAFGVSASADFRHVGEWLADFENTFPFARLTRLSVQAVTPGYMPESGPSQRLGFQVEFTTLVNTNAGRL